MGRALMKQINFLFGIHNHQPARTFHHAFRTALASAAGCVRRTFALA